MRRVSIVFFLLVSLTASAALKTEKFSISFSENDFLLSYDDNGCLVIESVKPACVPETNEPGLPLFSTNFAISGNSSYISSTPKYTKRLIRTDVRVAQSPLPVPTNCVPDESVTYREPYDLTVYPSSNCNYVTSSEWGDITVLHFLSCPFVYDAQEKNLYFVDSIELDITLDERLFDTPMKYKRTETAILKSFVKNADAIDSLMAMRPVVQDVKDKVDYVIITKKSLESSFEQLLQWKRMKGLYSKIITIEYIDSAYTGADIQVKLKKCLYDLYSNNELRYVLLGGDDTVVPVRGCYGEVTYYDNNTKTEITLKDITIPTDLYYACFGGDFEWDGNKNGVYGEAEDKKKENTGDNINLSPSIYVTRVPVRLPKDVTAFVDKLLSYEKGQHWNNNILMCGNCLSENELPTKLDDAEVLGDKLYSDNIKPYWDGKRVKFYNTYTDFPTGANYDLSPENLKEQLSKGYSFMDMITHGSQTTWILENYTAFYIKNDTTPKTKIKNSGSTIITTTACTTNAFDMSYNGGNEDPCLSESFIRNDSSGIVAYLGCSRQNWFNKAFISYSADFQYESKFYKKLFSDSEADKNYGLIVASAKVDLISNCSSNGSFRWVQFGLNPIGDPEMPIYTSEPKLFDKIEFIHSEYSMAINTGGPRCRICIMSADDDGSSYYEVYDGVQYLSLPDTIPFNIVISITSQGYIPTFYKVCHIQNESLLNDKVYDCDIVKIGERVVPGKTWGDVVVKSGKTTINASDVIIYSGTVENGAELIINNKE